MRWRYITDRFVIDVCLEAILAKKQCTLFFKCIKRFCAFKSNASSQLLFLNVAHISRFAKRTCYIIRSTEERHFVQHVMVETLWFFVNFFLLSFSLSLPHFTTFFTAGSLKNVKMHTKKCNEYFEV